MNHSQWRTRRTKRLLDEEMTESPAYLEAGHAFALGQAVYDRRTELGLSQADVADRAQMTQPQISNIEGGDALPTLPLLTRLARALDSSLIIEIDDGTSVFRFNARSDPGPAGPTTGFRSSAA